MHYVFTLHWEFVVLFLVFGGGWFVGLCLYPGSRLNRKSLQNWMPVTVALLLACGVIIVRAQEPSALSNAMQIGALQRQVTDLGDIPMQMSAIRDRMTAVEVTQKQQGIAIDSINSMVHWVVFGVFGILGTQILQRFRWVGIGRDDDRHKRRHHDEDEMAQVERED